MYSKAIKLQKKIYVGLGGIEMCSLIIMSSSDPFFALRPSSIATAHSIRLRHLTISMARPRLDQDIHCGNPGSRSPRILIRLRKNWEGSAILKIFTHHGDGGTTAVWRWTEMVGGRIDGLTCGNSSVSASEGRRAEKERENRVAFELEEGSVDCDILIETFRRSRAGSPMGRPRRERISEVGLREGRGGRISTNRHERKQMHKEDSTTRLDDKGHV